jgi:hypothetical protein
MCSICELRIDFEVAHPLGLSAAAATRRGIEARLLPEASSEWTRRDATGLMQGIRERLERVLAPASLRALPSFFVLLVETRSWAYFSPGEAGFDPTAQRSPPGEATLLTTETALAPMLAGRLPFQQALAEGMLVIEACPSDSDALQAAWARSWPVAGFSRLVCS